MKTRTGWLRRTWPLSRRRVVGAVLALGSLPVLVVLPVVLAGCGSAPAGPTGLHLIGHTDQVNSVAFSPSGRLLASGSNDGTIRIWDVRDGRQLGGPLHIPGSYVKGIAFSPDGRTLASASNDSIVRLWDVHTHWVIGKKHGSPPWAARGFFGLAWSADGQTLAAGGGNDSAIFTACGSPEILLWHPRGDRVTHIPNAAAGCVETVVFSPGGSTLVSGSDDGTIELWNLRHRRPPGRVLVSLNPTQDVYDREVWSLADSPDGRILAAGTVGLGEKRGSVRLWNPRTGKEIGPPLPDHPGHDWGVHSVAFSPDGRTLAAGSYADTIQLWDVRTYRQLAQWRGHSDGVRSVAFSPDGCSLASAGRNGTVWLWKLTGTDFARRSPLRRHCHI